MRLGCLNGGFVLKLNPNPFKDLASKLRTKPAKDSVSMLNPKDLVNSAYSWVKSKTAEPWEIINNGSLAGAWAKLFLKNLKKDPGKRKNKDFKQICLAKRANITHSKNSHCLTYSDILHDV